MGRINKDHFFVIGVSHKTAPVEVREKVSFDAASCGSVLDGICSVEGIREGVVVSTCNRTEIYAVIEGSTDDIRERIERFLLDTTEIDPEALACFYHHRGEKAIEHLFRVASGLDSMILGEPQIFGQVKEAYASACDLNCTGPALNRLFHTAFRVGKRIRNMTAIGEGAVSVSFAAVEMARHVFGDLRGHAVLLVGAGKMGELSAKRLVDIGISRLFIANRTHERACELAGKLGGEAVPYDIMLDLTDDIDILITSVAAREPVILGSDIEDRVAGRDGRPLLLIDLGVPRNIAAETGGFDGVTLCNIDDLEGLTLDNMDKRRTEAEKAEEIISAEVEEFSTWLSEREVIPVIRNLHAVCENIRAEEIEKIKNRVSPETLETIDLVTRRIVRKMLHNPVIRMRESESGDQRDTLLRTVRELFMSGPE